MNKIPSFTINHEKLLRGIYVSRKDEVGNEVVTTFDIRMKEPNREPVVHPGALHTIEHLAATFLRNDEEWKDRVIYWGPMGCLTGNYLLLRGDLEAAHLPLHRRFRGRNPRRCTTRLRQLPAPRPADGPMGSTQIPQRGAHEDDRRKHGLSAVKDLGGAEQYC